MNTLEEKRNQNRIPELIRTYHKGVDWEREGKRIRAEIVERMADKKCDGLYCTVGEWLEKARDMETDELICAIRTWYDNYVPEDIDIGEIVSCHRQRGDVVGVIKAFESVCEGDDVRLSEYVEKIEAAWTKNKPHSMVLKKGSIHSKPSTDEKIASQLALADLMEINKKMVHFFIKKYYPTYHNSAEHEDIYSEGLLGMLQSMIYYDPDISRFSTFATTYVKGAISDYLSKKNFGSMHYQMRNKNYNKAIESLLMKGIQNPNTTQVAEEMGVGIDAVQKFKGVMQKANAVDLDNNEVLELEDVMSVKPDDLVIIMERDEKIKEALKLLPKDQRIVSDMIWYTKDGKAAPYNEIGKVLAAHYSKETPDKPVKDIKVEKIRQLRAKAIKTMRAFMNREWKDNDEKVTGAKGVKVAFTPKMNINDEVALFDQVMNPSEEMLEEEKKALGDNDIDEEVDLDDIMKKDTSAPESTGGTGGSDGTGK